MRTRTVLVTFGAVGAASAVALTGCGGTQTATSKPVAAHAALHPAALTAGAPTGGTAAASQPTVTTTGTGTVNGAPDTMTIAIDVSTTAPHVSAALGQNNAVAAKVQQALGSGGVATADIQTSGLSLQPTYPPSPVSYQVDDTVTATLRNLATAGTVIDQAVAAAGDAGRLGGVNLLISDTSPLMATAREQAVTTARTDAQQLASAAGEHLGALISLTDQPQQSSSPYLYAAGSPSAAGSAPVPVKPGAQQLSVNVTAVWAVGP